MTQNEQVKSESCFPTVNYSTGRLFVITAIAIWWTSGKVQVEGAHFSNLKLEPCFILSLGMSVCAIYVTGKNSFGRELIIATNNRQPGKLAWSNSVQLRQRDI